MSLAVLLHWLAGFAFQIGATVNVADFGARADGKTDLSPALQRAYDALPPTGGRIQIPAARGEYVVVASKPTVRRPKVGLRISKPNVFVEGVGGRPTIRMTGVTLDYLNSIDDVSASGRDVFTVFSFVLTDGGGVSNVRFVGEWNGEGRLRYQSPRAKAIAVIGSRGVRIRDVEGECLLGNLVNANPAGQTVEPVHRWSENVTVEDVQAVRCLENGVNFMGGTRNCVLRRAVLIGNGSCGAESGGTGNRLRDLLCAGNGYAGVSLSQAGQTLEDSRLVANGTAERAEAGFGLVLQHSGHRVGGCDIRGNAHYGVYLYPGATDILLQGCTVQGNCVGPRSEAVAEVRLSEGAGAILQDCSIVGGGKWRTVRCRLEKSDDGWRLRPTEAGTDPAAWKAYEQTQARNVNPAYTLWLQEFDAGAGSFRCRVTSGNPTPGEATLAMGSRARYGVFASAGASPTVLGGQPVGFTVPVLRQ
ncbi:MAG: right-handed parallel beta-helix repeat-containing protein [Armatimonadetes bacterium]|nr:right-handed parallel beta-helix repeat-containing protein [Armatimonadota bacterium]